MATSKFKIDSVRKLLKQENTFAFTLMAIALDLYGDDVFTKDPAELFKDIEEDTKGNLCEENENKLNAAITVMTSDVALRDPEVFTAVAKSFSAEDIDDIVDGDPDDELGATEALWAIMEIGLLNDETFEATEEQMSRPVIDCINAAMDNEGIDLDEVEADDTETREEAEQDIEKAALEPYYRKACTLNLLELMRQLLSLGVSKDIVAAMLATYNHGIDELEIEVWE